MSSSNFLYNWENIIHVINKIYSIINFKESKCGLYTMDCISQSPIHCSKGNIRCVLKCTKFPGKQATDYMFEKKWSSIEDRNKKLGDGLKKRGNNKYTCPMFDNECLASWKQLKISQRYYYFQ